MSSVGLCLAGGIRHEHFNHKEREKEMEKIKTVTPEDKVEVSIRETFSFVSEEQFLDMCKQSGTVTPSEFAEYYGYVYLVPAKVDGVDGWICFS